MPISRAIARRVTEAVPSAAICALATVLISSTVARRSRSLLVVTMLTDDTIENTIHYSEAPSLLRREHHVLDWSKYRRAFGPFAPTPHPEAVARTVAWFRDHPRKGSGNPKGVPR